MADSVGIPLVRVDAVPPEASCIIDDEMQADSPSSHPDLRAVPVPTYVYWGGSNLYVNLTSRCSASCTFCLRSFTWEVFGYDLHLFREQEPEAAQVIAAMEVELDTRSPREVVFTGLGEPTLRLGALLEVLTWTSSRRLRTRLDTNGHGQLLNPGHRVAEELAQAGLAAVSVSLNAPDAATYDALCRPKIQGAFEAVLQFIQDAHRCGLEVTVTAVEVPGLDLTALMELAAGFDAALRIRRLVTAPTEPVEAGPS